MILKVLSVQMRVAIYLKQSYVFCSFIPLPPILKPDKKRAVPQSSTKWPGWIELRTLGII